MATMVTDDIPGKDIYKRGIGIELAPGKYLPGEMISVEMTRKNINRLTLGQNLRQANGGIHPIVKNQYAGVDLYCKTTMEYICQFQISQDKVQYRILIYNTHWRN